MFLLQVLVVQALRPDRLQSAMSLFASKALGKLAWENSRRFAGRHLSPRKTTPEKRAQKFHTDDVHYPDLGSDSDWLKKNSLVAQPIRTTTKIWVVTRHQCGISALVAQTSFCEGLSGDLAKRRLFSQAIGKFVRVIIIVVSTTARSP